MSGAPDDLSPNEARILQRLTDAADDHNSTFRGQRADVIFALATISRLTAENARLAKELEEAKAALNTLAERLTEVAGGRRVWKEACEINERACGAAIKRAETAEAALAEVRAEGWRQGIEAAATLLDTRAFQFGHPGRIVSGDGRLLKILETEAIGLARAIRSLPSSDKEKKS